MSVPPATVPPPQEIRGIRVYPDPCEVISPEAIIVTIPGCGAGRARTPQEYVNVVVGVALAAAPRPALKMAPGWALTGKLGYLEVIGPSTFSGNGGDDTPVSWACAADGSEVDWGDGTTEAIIRAAAGPWPDGGVRHAYTTAGQAKVTLRDRWACQFTTPTGTVALGLTTVTAPLTLRIDQVQAVGIS